MPISTLNLSDATPPTVPMDAYTKQLTRQGSVIVYPPPKADVPGWAVAGGKNYSNHISVSTTQNSTNYMAL